MTNASLIAKSFGAASATYASHSEVQQKAATILAEKLQLIKGQFPAGPVLEVACGTGIFTRHLIAALPEHEFVISDISQAMVDTCRANIQHAAQFVTRNAEDIDEENKYALIACAFAAQWFTDIESTIRNLTGALIPGGYLIFSLPTDGSFPEWKEVCRKLDIDFSGNKLPQVSEIESFCKSTKSHFDLQTEDISVSYKSSLHFFKGLKALGASHRLNTGEDNSLPVPLNSIIRCWDKENPASVHATYQVLFGVLQK